MPAHEDWLNDLSLTPPVSSTMQALIVLPVLVFEDELVTELELPPDGWLDEPVVPPPALPPPLLLLPHADRASVTAATPAITALVRRPRTLEIPSRTGIVDPPGCHICDTVSVAGAPARGWGVMIRNS
jgi:hypothetical protein